MRRCSTCFTYTFRETCPLCGSPTSPPGPPPYRGPRRR
ncbi:MAG: nucleolar RNA-binding Nop10p family protein [Candidatus Korarchaeota archaeon]|nr:nucleolar RNA-binding Nop10p family protein [Candidatus Korarchaeota archaeon]